MQFITKHTLQNTSIVPRIAFIGDDRRNTRSKHDKAVRYTDIVENSPFNNEKNLLINAIAIMLITVHSPDGKALAIMFTVKLPVILFLLG